MPLREDILKPLDGPNPAGTNLRYDPIYTQIKTAREEEPDLPRRPDDPPRKVADFRVVAKLTTQALTATSKDLWLAAWLTEALTRTQGASGLREGLELIHGLIDQFWESLYPEIEEGDLDLRAGPLQWVGSYYEPKASGRGGVIEAARALPLNLSGHSRIVYRDSLRVPTDEEGKKDPEKLKLRQQATSEGKLTPEEWRSAFKETPKSWYKQLVADLNACLEEVEALDEFGDVAFASLGDDRPSYRILREELELILQDARHILAAKLAEDPDPVEVVEPVVVVGEPEFIAGDVAMEAATNPSAAEASSVKAPSAAVAMSPLPRDRNDAAARVAAVARFLRSESPTDPAPYLLLRGFRWGELRARGDSIDPRLLDAPPTDVRTRLKSLLLDGRWPELLETAEETLAAPHGRGWLDLQRYVLAACTELGDAYQPVALAVRGALTTLLRDLPDLLDQTLMDDSPTANPETRRWLQESGILQQSQTGAGDAPLSAPAPRFRSERDSLEWARERVRAGQSEMAIDTLLREGEREKSVRARFIRKAQAAEIMVEAGLEPVAKPILDELVKLIEKHGLEEWEAGETVAQPLGLLYRCLRKMEGESGAAQALYLRVCRLDPLQAIRFKNGRTDEQQGG